MCYVCLTSVYIIIGFFAAPQAWGENTALPVGSNSTQAGPSRDASVLTESMPASLSSEIADAIAGNPNRIDGNPENASELSQIEPDGRKPEDRIAGFNGDLPVQNQEVAGRPRENAHPPILISARPAWATGGIALLLLAPMLRIRQWRRWLLT